MNIVIETTIVEYKTFEETILFFAKCKHYHSSSGSCRLQPVFKSWRWRPFFDALFALHLSRSRVTNSPAMLDWRGLIGRINERERNLLVERRRGAGGWGLRGGEREEDEESRG